MRWACAAVRFSPITSLSISTRNIVRESPGVSVSITIRSIIARFEKLGRLMDEAEHDVLAYMTFAAQHRTKLHSTNPLERLNKEVKRRADVVGIFPNEESIVRLVGAVLMEQNDDWQTQNRYMQIEGFAEPADKTADLKPLQITPKAA